MSLEEEKLESEIKSLKLALIEKESTLQKLQEKLKIKNNEFEDFTYIISHDLNEPLRTVDSFIKIIAEEYHDPKNKESDIYFSFISSAIIKMKKLIKGLSDLSKIGTNQIYQKTNINEVINTINKEISDLIKEKDVTIIKPTLPEITCLKLEINTLLKSLILNSIKFQNSNTKPVITINYEEGTNYWIFCVKDNGIGINAKNHENIFKIFNKLHTESTYKGTGVGLAFCKKIIELHEGKIWLKSKENEGSAFYFSVSKKLQNNTKI